MKKAKLLFIILILFARIPHSVFAQTTIQFSNSNIRPIPQYINGINETWFTFPRIQNQGVKDVIAETNVNPIRFPGGTHGNVYDWQVFAPNWSNAATLAVPYVINSQSGFEKQVQNLSPLDSAQTIKSINEKDVLITVNALFDNPANIKNALIKLQQAGITLKWIEIGNEDYYYTAIQKSDAYLVKAQQIAADAKVIFPGVKIGVVIDDEYYFWKTKNTNEWVIPNADWYDAIIVHPYVGSNAQLLKDGKIDQFNTKFPFNIRTKLNDFLTTVSSIYPNKEVWPTEWNISETNAEQYLGGAYASAFHAYNVLLTFLQYPQITLASFHALFGGTYGIVGVLPSIQSQYFSTPSQFVPDTVTGPQLFYKKLSYWPLVCIGDAIKKNTSYIIADGTLIPTAPYGAVYFYTADYSHQSLALINRTNQTLTLDVSGLSHLLATPVTVNRLQQDWQFKVFRINLFPPPFRP